MLSSQEKLDGQAGNMLPRSAQKRCSDVSFPTRTDSHQRQCGTFCKCKQREEWVKVSPTVCVRTFGDDDDNDHDDDDGVGKMFGTSFAQERGGGHGDFMNTTRGVENGVSGCTSIDRVIGNTLAAPSACRAWLFVEVVLKGESQRGSNWRHHLIT